MDLQALIPMINSADVEDFNLAVALIEARGWRKENVGVFLKTHIDRDRFVVFLAEDGYKRATDMTFKQGLWEQMNGGSKHTFSLSTGMGGMKIIEEAIQKLVDKK